MTSVPAPRRSTGMSRRCDRAGRHGRSRLSAFPPLLAVILASSASSLGAQSRIPHLVLPQPLLAVAHNHLTFGTVLPGVAITISANDPRAGMFEIQGPPAAAIRVEFILPAALVTPDGLASLPLHFGPGDGFADFNKRSPPVGSPFDPHNAVIGSLGPDGRLFLRLGGTALPGRPQTTGIYKATIFISVFDVGT